MIPRTLEPEVMDDAEEVQLYGEMNHAEVNQSFVEDLLAGGPVGSRVIDLGCGTGLIPVLLCQQDPEVEVLAVDASINMLEAARTEIEMGGVQGRVFLEHADCKELSVFEPKSCQTLISNSLLHHLPEPTTVLQDALALIKPGGRLFLRDLLRPVDEPSVEALVEKHASSEPPVAQQLLRQSLHAALSESELETMVGELGISKEAIRITSDRHWTIDATIDG